MIKLFSSYFLGGISTSVVSALLYFLMTHLLVPDVYAQGMLLISLLNICFSMCNMGMDKTCLRLFYEPLYKEHRLLLFYRCLVIILFCFVGFLFFLLWFRQDALSYLQMDNGMIFFYLAIGIILTTLLEFGSLISRLKEHVLIYSLVGFFRYFFFIILFLIIFYLGIISYWAILLAQLISMVLVITGLLIFYKQKIEIFPIYQKEIIFDKRELKKILAYGIPNFLSFGLSWVLLNIDKFFVLKYFNYQILGVYSAAFLLTSPLITIQTIFLTAWTPKMNYLLIHSPFKAKKTFFIVFEKINFIMICSILTLIFFKNYQLFLIGSAFHSAINFFPWLLFIPYFLVLSEIVGAGIIKSKTSYWHVCVFCSAIGVNVLGCSLLIPIMGVTGVVISIAISYAVFFLIRCYIAFRYYQFRINWIKLIIYIHFLCIFILLNDSIFFRSSLYVMFLAMSVLLERRWLYHDIKLLKNSVLFNRNNLNKALLN